MVDGGRRREADRAGEVAGDHRVGDHPVPFHILLSESLGFIGGEHQRIAPWRMAQKSASKELDTPVSCWHRIRFLFVAGDKPRYVKRASLRPGTDRCPWSQWPRS
jgi:hypothetical protein